MFGIVRFPAQEQEELITLLETQQRTFRKKLKTSFAKHLGDLGTPGRWG